jgi:hypothetical protein
MEALNTFSKVNPWFQSDETDHPLRFFHSLIDQKRDIISSNLIARRFQTQSYT